MINFLVLITSLLIQFGSLSLPQTVSIPSDFDFTSFVVQVQEDMLGRGGVFSFFGDNNLDSEGVFMYYDLPNNSVYRVYIILPTGLYDSSISSSLYLYYADSYGSTLITNYHANGYTGIVYDFDINNNTITYVRTFNPSETSVYYPSYSSYSPIWLMISNVLSYNGVEYLVPDDYIFLPDVSNVLGELGGIGHNGHAHDLSPLEVLQDEVGGFSSSLYHMKATGHSHSGLDSSSSSYDFSNAEQNLLGQVVNNSNDLINNTNGIYNELSDINSNIINGSIAIYNGMANMNNNFVETVLYDEEEVDSIVTNSQCYGFIHTSYDAIDEFYQTHDNILDAFQNQETLDELVIPIDLRVWSFGSDYGTITPYNNIYYLRFEFLDETKALWQPLLIALLYFAMFMTFYFDLPNLIRGQVK